MPDLFLELRDDGEQRHYTPAPLCEDEALTLLATADITDTKLIPWGSNYTFAVALETADGHHDQLAIYKPRAGEAPLYDFPDGTLYLRETAAYLLSRELGWKLVPPTIVRNGPHGIGSVQLYIEPVSIEDGRELQRFWGAKSLAIERLVLFDHITNNADRKIGHCLRDRDGHIWGIDHGLTFNQMPKLRTVLWQFTGDPISPELLLDLDRVRQREPALRTLLAPYLTTAELDATFQRIDRLLHARTYPSLNPRRNIPYGWW